MIEIIHKSDCCGCEACVQRCPKKCITLSEDEEGFLYPLIDRNSCIDCGLCNKVCPVINQDTTRLPVHVYAAKNRDESIRLSSSSGGVFSLIAEKVVSEGGVVFGAAFDENWILRHSHSDNLHGYEAFRESKYLQSHIGDAFLDVAKFLKNGRKVLFSGTPCQVAGLRRFLGKEYDHLLTVDFICHGVPSPGMFRKYLLEEVNRCIISNDSQSAPVGHLDEIPPQNAISKGKPVQIDEISFRNKSKGWKCFSFLLAGRIKKSNGDINFFRKVTDLQENPFLKGFLQDLYLRPSCYKCPAKELKSGSDITLADFWGVRKVFEGYDDDKGVSAVIVNTLRGRDIFDAIDVDKVESTYDIIRRYNSAIYKSPMEPQNRNAMFAYDKGFIETVNKLTKPSVEKRIKRIIKSFILKIK